MDINNCMVSDSRFLAHYIATSASGNVPGAPSTSLREKPEEESRFRLIPNVKFAVLKTICCNVVVEDGRAGR